MRRWLYWGAQAFAAAVVAVMVWRAIARNWSEFRSLQISLAPSPGWIALSVIVVFLTYALQVESWRRILAGWAQRLPYGRAARIWLVVNLGRYVPGKIWSVAGLIVLAQRAGVAPWAAGASAFAIQAIGIGTAVALVAAGSWRGTGRRGRSHGSPARRRSSSRCRLRPWHRAPDFRCSVG